MTAPPFFVEGSAFDGGGGRTRQAGNAPMFELWVMGILDDDICEHSRWKITRPSGESPKSRRSIVIVFGACVSLFEKDLRTPSIVPRRHFQVLCNITTSFFQVLRLQHKLSVIVNKHRRLVNRTTVSRLLCNSRYILIM